MVNVALNGIEVVMLYFVHVPYFNYAVNLALGNFIVTLFGKLQNHNKDLWNTVVPTILKDFIVNLNWKHVFIIEKSFVLES